MIDTKILQEIIQIHESQKLNFVLNIGKKSFPLEKVIITKSSTPLTKPNIRGGVYFSDTTIFKIKGITNDLSLLPILSDSMLGPNSKFQDLKINTKIPNQNGLKDVTILANLTNTIQSSSKLELVMNIVGINKK